MPGLIIAGIILLIIAIVLVSGIKSFLKRKRTLWSV